MTAAPDPDEPGIGEAERSRRVLYVRHVAVQAQHGHEPIPFDRFHGGYHDGMREFDDDTRARRWGLSSLSARDPRERRRPGSRFLARRNTA